MVLSARCACVSVAPSFGRSNRSEPSSRGAVLFVVTGGLPSGAGLFGVSHCCVAALSPACGFDGASWLSSGGVYLYFGGVILVELAPEEGHEPSLLVSVVFSRL